MTILDSAELLLQAKNYSGSGAWLDESGNGHDAQLGFTSGSDSNDPLHKAHSGGTVNNYAYFPGTAGNNLTVTLDATTTYDYTITYEDDSTDTDEQVSNGSGVLTFGDTDVKFSGLDVKKIDVVPDGGGSTLALFDASGVTEPFATYTDGIPEVWTFNEASSGHPLTLVDRAMFLHTTDDYSEIADHANLDIGASNDFTAMVVMRLPRTPTGFQTLLAKKSSIFDSAAGWYLFTPDSLGTSAKLSDGTNDTEDETAAAPQVNVLHSVGFVRNVTDDDVEAFLDGVGSGSPATDATIVTLANSLPLRIGSSADREAEFHEGQIVAVATWTSALSDTEMGEADDLLTSVALPGVFPPFRRRKNILVRI